MSLTRARPSAGLSLLVAPVAAGGVDVVFAEDLAGAELDDGDAGRVGEGEDGFAGVSGADAEVVHAPGEAEGYFAVKNIFIVNRTGPAGAELAPVSRLSRYYRR